VVTLVTISLTTSEAYQVFMIIALNKDLDSVTKAVILPKIYFKYPKGVRQGAMREFLVNLGVLKKKKQKKVA